MGILHSNGYEGYLVGGWVRDRILGRECADIDIATDAPPETVTKIFRGENIRVIPTGVEHGTVTIIHEHLNPGVGYEITTYRHDVSCDGRNATVKFAKTLKEDLSRRDFTMNAIAYDPITDEFIDPYGGIKDIGKGLIRCVGNADERFKEDHLRMLRALRFKANLGFEIETDTFEAIIMNSSLITKISAERIKSEIFKCFDKSDTPSLMFRTEHLLRDAIFPELKPCIGFAQNKYHKHDVFNHTMIALDAVPKEYPLIRWAILFHDLGKPESCENYGTPHASFHQHEVISERMAKKIMRRLKFSNHEIKYISNLIRCHMFQHSSDMKDSAIRRFVTKLGRENIDAICIMKWADRTGSGKPTGELNIRNTGLRKRFDKILTDEAAFKLSDMKIDGHDIMEILEIEGGKELGIILKALFELVLDDPSLNNKETLTGIVRKEFGK